MPYTAVYPVTVCRLFERCKICIFYNMCMYMCTCTAGLRPGLVNHVKRPPPAAFQVTRTQYGISTRGTFTYRLSGQRLGRGLFRAWWAGPLRFSLGAAFPFDLVSSEKKRGSNSRKSCLSRTYHVHQTSAGLLSIAGALVGRKELLGPHP